MKKNRFMLLFSFMLIICNVIYAQTKTVSGVVTEKSTGAPLPGVTILEKGTTNGTVTDLDGKFSFVINEGGIIHISFIGFKPQDISVAGKSVFPVALEEDAVALGEVVAVGYGVVKKSDVTGSVGSVSAEKLLQAPITSLDAGLQGKVAGVSIQQTTGAPGQAMKIRVRGGSSINYSNEPLYVIDGFIGADITTINPSDIASIDILKDASATAIYGSRGANGVVLITTNSPTEGKMVVSFDGNVGVSNMVNSYDLLSAGDMTELMNIQQASKGNSPNFTDDEVAYFKKNGGTDWVDLVTRQGVRQNYTLNMNGGSKKLKYFFSANSLNDQGVIKESYYKRSSIRSNISGEVSKWIDFVFNTYGTHTESQNNGRQSNGLNNSIGSAVAFPQVWESRDENGDFIIPSTYDSYGGRWNPGSVANPEQSTIQNQETFNEKIISNLDLTFKFSPQWSLFVSNAGSFSTGFEGKRDLIDNVKYKDNSEVGAEQLYKRGYTFTNTDVLTYENTFDRHSLKVSGIYEYSESTWRSNKARVVNLSTVGNEWDLLGNGEPSITNSKFATSKIESVMARVNYSFADKYLLTASVRMDGASVFSEDKRWGTFPSAAFAWRASEESFIQDIDWIHNLKLRTGYGVTGNRAVDPYAILPSFDGEDNAYIWWVQDGLNPSSGIIPAAPTDYNLVWEKNAMYNIGLDMAVLNGRLSFIFDYYEKKASDVIIATTKVMHEGLPSLTSNVADIDNKGFEFAANWEIMNKSDFVWDMNVNISQNKNKVVDLNNESGFVFVADEDALGIWMGNNTKFIVAEGESMGSFYGLRSLGLWQEDEAAEALTYKSRPGEHKYEDINGDGKINNADRQIVGNASPDFTYGIGTSLRYKGLDFALQCVGSSGNEIFNYSKNILDREILNPDYHNRWSPTNTNSSQPIMPIGTEYRRSHLTSEYIEDGSFFKISNITIGYTIPKSFASKLHISSARLYMSADNILTITNYSGLDPEGSSTSLTSDSQAGVDAFSYPLVRTISGGLKVVF